jgi:hypothetical protein
MNVLDQIAARESLLQSSVVRNRYIKQFNRASTQFHSNYDFVELEDLFQQMVSKCSSLTKFQIHALHRLFQAFDAIRVNIDPDRLKTFEFCTNTDHELLIYRKSKSGLTNIIIHEEETIALSFIPINPNLCSKLDFFEKDCDMEYLALYLFSK